MIKFENVTKQYNKKDRPAVKNLDLYIEKGEICMLVGPSGCGKTTIMRMINKLIKLSSGKIFLDDKNINDLDSRKIRLDIGYVIQDTGLFPHMTIAENIATVPIEKKWDKERINKRVDELLEIMELNPKIYRDKKPKDLSGGQRQRVGIARALAADPPILLMDEPFGALDPITRAKLQDELLLLQEKFSKTIVFVTHDIDEAIKLGNKIAVMNKGELVQFGTPHEILSNPANDFVSELTGGSSNIKMLHLVRCDEIMSVPSEDELKKMNKTNVISSKTTLHDALSVMFSLGTKRIFIKNKNEIGMITMDDLLKKVKNDD